MHTQVIAVVGLGYVGMPLAVAFAEKWKHVIGFDINDQKIRVYKSGIDPTKEVGDEKIKETTIEFTSDEQELRKADFIVVAVPTPVNGDHTPDLTPVTGASEIVGRNLKKGAIVVYESTVYPGCTEMICKKILEEQSGMKCGEDFSIGYSPERINPGDKVHRLHNIKKIVSGSDKESTREIQEVYDTIIDAGTYKVSNIRTAEAIKVVENSQRDVNIAFMNELALAFDRMDIDTSEVVDGMNTKWNALGFRPGLVGGHCIGVDPYYFINEAEEKGYSSQIILSGRRINDSMGRFVADAAVKKMVMAGLAPKHSRVAILGLTFKENCPDLRNSKVDDVYRRLKEYGIHPAVTDPYADPEEAMREYGIELVDLKDIHDVDCLILAVAHDVYKQISLSEMLSLFKQDGGKQRVLIDIKNLFSKEELSESGVTWWKL